MLVFVLEALAPTVARALTSGPSQPEFSGFEPVGTTGLVNEATGGFSYSIPIVQVPGPNGSTYPLTLSYHSNTGVEEDASWVGYGWTLNAGSINRSVRGLPDDINGENIIEYHSQPMDETYAVGNSIKPQAASIDIFSFDRAVTYNTRAGYSLVSGMSLNVGNMLSLDLRRDNGRMRYGIRPNWANLFSMAATEWLAEKGQAQIKKEIAAATGMKKLIMNAMNKQRLQNIQKQATVFSTAANYVVNMMNSSSMPVSTLKYSGEDYHLNFGSTLAIPGIPIIIGGHGGVRGSYSVKRFGDNTGTAPDHSRVTAYGYMYQKSGIFDADMQDYSTQVESSFDTRDRYISPAYSGADMFSASGQGISGAFRFWQQKPGAYRPRKVTSSRTQLKGDVEGSLSLDKLSLGSAVSFGYDETTVQGNLNTALAAAFLNEGYADRVKNGVFARMTNDPADRILYYPSDAPEYSFGGGAYVASAYSRINNAASGLERPRSSTAVQFRTNQEMTGFLRATGSGSATGTGGFTKGTMSVHSTSVSKTSGLMRSGSNIHNRIGEVAMTTSSGMTYVYGLPVYSCDERSLQFMGRRVADSYRHWNKLAQNKDLSTTDPKVQVTGTYRAAPYPGSHLLTEVRTPDYIDLKNDGLTMDDLGGWTSFTYRKAAGGQTSRKQDWFRWRMPYSGFYYHAGSHTSGSDDRATVSSGYRELHYLEKIETKTHVAYFVTNKTNKTVTVGGQTLSLQGSNAKRLDAWEAYNATGRYDEDEKVSAEWKDSALLPAVYQGPEHVGLYGKKLGGRRWNSDPWGADGDPVEQGLARENKSEYLEKIILVAKKPTTGYELLQTVNLEYTYELQESRAGSWVQTTIWDPVLMQDVEVMDVNMHDTIYAVPGRLNSSVMFTSDRVHPAHTATRMNGKRFGKLTLKRVWMDYGTAKRADIAPYEFEYLYRDNKKNPYPKELEGNILLDSTREYGRRFSHSDTGSLDYLRNTKNIQNPGYDPIYVDPWGSYRGDGYGATQNFQSHLNQRQQAGSNFDPAAWQLKVVRLPSGAEIHVQYEANSYAFVQDQPAMAFVQVKGVENVGGDYVYELKLDSDVSGLYMTPAEVADRLRAYIRQYRQRIYYKFLAKVQPSGISPSASGFPFYGVDYITGHSDVSESDVVTWPTGVDNRVGVKFNDDYTPSDLAKEFALTRRIGYVSNVVSKNQYARRFQYRNMTKQMTLPDKDWLMPSEIGSKEESILKALISSASGINGDIQAIEAMFQNEPLYPINKFSFIRVPCGSKRGAGVRVKRIVMYDPGIETGAAAMYGSEYLYETTVDGRTVSSGVVTTEPGEIRDESSLTTYLVGRDDKNFLDKLGSGDDMEQMEGPLCANAYPSPQLMYSRVVTRPIFHTLPTAPGFVVSEFNTARDYPVIVESTELYQLGADMPPIIPSSSPVDVSLGTRSVAQGYTVKLNAMHGTPKSMTKYAGKYDDPTTWSIVESTQFEYYAPGEGVSVLRRGEGYDGTVEAGVRLGVDMDAVLETRSIDNNRATAQVPFDVGIMFMFPPVLFGHVGMPKAQIGASHLDLRVLTKVVTSNVLPKRTVTTKNGMVHVEENLVFDPQSGKPCIVRSFDETYKNYQTTTSSYNDKAQQVYTVPASFVYPELGSKSFNDMLTMPCTGAPVSVSGNIYTLTLTNASDKNYLTPGDLVRVGGIVPTDRARLFHVTAINPTLTLHETSFSTAWGTAPGMYYLTVVQSGRKQLLDAQAGSIQQFSHQVKATQTLDPLANVIRASATTYSDNWPSTIPNPGPGTYTDYELGKLGRWRPRSNYSWKSSVLGVFDASPSMRGNYENGYASSFTGFSYGSPPAARTAPWLLTSTITGYDDQGNAVSEQDALDIPSTASFTTPSMLPSMIAKNAEMGTIYFESFESLTSNVASTAHTGTRARSFTTTPVTLTTLTKGSRTGHRGLTMQYWVASNAASPVTVTINGTTQTPVQMARAGEWVLFQIVASDATVGAMPSTFTVTMRAATGTVAVDDIRIQPTTSEATCYVYDPGLRLAAQFDDRHFAMVYQYTSEGKLSYKSRETERGLVTIEERQYNTPRMNRPMADGAALPGSIVAQSTGRRTFSGPAGAFGGIGPSQPMGVGAKGSIIDLKASPTRRTIRLFDNDSVNVPDLDSLRRGVETKMNKNMKDSR
ncbi:MAG: hypothetical protein J0I17_12330 ['Candidatus Kapabacteria' thiocyanatum]|uniref:Uncharacterized protein n=1 Tax=Candidatus Kapaibacterium thiocyanatum TaxID=1895771 RepID=A0A1M3L1V4_9BACT|nr:hypothetical protein ['Candidatus Kapabacteria' thiocyanatum]OJX58824.1 MAG: hypothetical protein BGO89_03430 ['Candidatus Kapabacteria' thiocyanatum]